MRVYLTKPAIGRVQAEKTGSPIINFRKGFSSVEQGLGRLSLEYLGGKLGEAAGDGFMLKRKCRGFARHFPNANIQF